METGENKIQKNDGVIRIAVSTINWEQQLTNKCTNQAMFFLLTGAVSSMVIQDAEVPQYKVHASTDW